ncbi:hypothetical protein BJ875DRAFT_525764 [Amylocarpus encephaloides]|uniref:DUF7924 domain-containing protein n=1 Tax=Amylocarpus encephaloides TaxID=45428 RepID=A0A9P7Y926_9HELO|nr:hypothetical protein BJ875DRAFT_525764 [Amylocarpus encephaloides]
MATWQMYLAFLTCEVKCGATTLDITDRQNAHSMTLAVRGVVKLFRLVKREKELHQESSRFQFRTIIVRWEQDLLLPPPDPQIRFHGTREGKEKWSAYKFTKNIYDIWMPTQLKRICSVIDDLPLDLDSRGLESHHLPDQSSHDATYLVEGADNQPSRVGSGDITPDTSLSQRIEGGAFKKPRNRGDITKSDWKARLVDLHFAKELNTVPIELVTELYFAIHSGGGASRLDSLNAHADNRQTANTKRGHMLRFGDIPTVFAPEYY